MSASHPRTKLIRDLQNAVAEHHELVRELHKQQRKYIGLDFKVQDKHVFIGTQPCEHSPTGTHVYDLHWDPDKVNCLYEN